jgi:hypothetical protein
MCYSIRSSAQGMSAREWQRLASRCAMSRGALLDGFDQSLSQALADLHCTVPRDAPAPEAARRHEEVRRGRLGRRRTVGRASKGSEELKGVIPLSSFPSPSSQQARWQQGPPAPCEPAIVAPRSLPHPSFRSGGGGVTKEKLSAVLAAHHTISPYGMGRSVRPFISRLPSLRRCVQVSHL